MRVLHWVAQDHLGGTVRTLDAAFNVVDSVRYKPYGSDRDAGTNLRTDRKFTGQTEDEVSGLYFYKSRYYDAHLGRFVQPDTVVPTPTNPQSLNRYTYVLNNPLRYADPTGRYYDGFQGDYGGDPSDPSNQDTTYHSHHRDTWASDPEYSGSSSYDSGGYATTYSEGDPGTGHVYEDYPGQLDAAEYSQWDMARGGRKVGAVAGVTIHEVERRQDTPTSHFLADFATVLDMAYLAVTTFATGALLASPVGGLPTMAAAATFYAEAQVVTGVMDALATAAVVYADIDAGRTRVVWQGDGAQVAIGTDTLMSLTTFVGGGPPSRFHPVAQLGYDVAQVRYDLGRLSGATPAYSTVVTIPTLPARPW